jgi:hypothetical protein
VVPEKVSPPELTYATVEKRRRLVRVVEILIDLIFGTMHPRWRPGWRTTSGRCVSGSRCPLFNAPPTQPRIPPRILLRASGLIVKYMQTDRRVKGQAVNPAIS